MTTLWQEALEEASRLCVVESNVEGMLVTHMPLHEMKNGQALPFRISGHLLRLGTPDLDPDFSLPSTFHSPTPFQPLPPTFSHASMYDFTYPCRGPGQGVKAQLSTLAVWVVISSCLPQNLTCNLTFKLLCYLYISFCAELVPHSSPNMGSTRVYKTW